MTKSEYREARANERAIRAMLEAEARPRGIFRGAFRAAGALGAYVRGLRSQVKERARLVDQLAELHKEMRNGQPRAALAMSIQDRLRALEPAAPTPASAHTMTRQRRRAELRAKWYKNVSQAGTPRADRRQFARAVAASDFKNR